MLGSIGLNLVKAELVKRPEHCLANGVQPYLGSYLEKARGGSGAGSTMFWGSRRTLKGPPEHP